MSLSLDEIRLLCTKAEFALISASRSPSIEKLSTAQLKKNAANARKLSRLQSGINCISHGTDGKQASQILTPSRMPNSKPLMTRCWPMKPPWQMLQPSPRSKQQQRSSHPGSEPPVREYLGKQPAPSCRESKRPSTKQPRQLLAKRLQPNLPQHLRPSPQPLSLQPRALPPRALQPRKRWSRPLQSELQSGLLWQALSLQAK